MKGMLPKIRKLNQKFHEIEDALEAWFKAFNDEFCSDEKSEEAELAKLNNAIMSELKELRSWSLAAFHRAMERNP